MPADISDLTSYINTDNGFIESGGELKILGFTFDRSPTAVTHVTKVIDSFYGKLWTLRFLKKGGMAKNDLLNVYRTVVLPGVEYCSTVYNPLIPEYVSEQLESVQKQALKIIYGWSVNYKELVQTGEIETLKQRREKKSLKFALRAKKNNRFEEWFPAAVHTDRDFRLTTRRPYREKQCKTERARNSPMQYMLRQLNEHESN